MQHIKIEKFGPIQFLDIDVKDVMAFVGPQASGKSTIAKVVFFFRSLRDDINGAIADHLRKDYATTHLKLMSVKKLISRKFLDYFGPSAPYQGMNLVCDYGDDKILSVNLEETHSYITPTFNNTLEKELKKLISEVNAFSKKRNPQAMLSSKDLVRVDVELNLFMSKISSRLNEIFNDDKELLYIPAGRSLLSTLSDQLQFIETRQLDSLMKSFIQRIVLLRPYFTKSMDDLITARMVLSDDGKIDFPRVNIAQKIIRRILKGRYAYDADGEKLYIDEHRYVKLTFASSGQQESLWILLLIFVAILEKHSMFMVIEEPEAHLYPEAQREIVSLIALLANSGSQVLVTTHSPYILASMNNLIFAGSVGARHPEIHERINRHLWLNRSNLYSAILNDGKATDIVDDALEIINQDVIDGVSSVINEDFDYLFGYEE